MAGIQRDSLLRSRAHVDVPSNDWTIRLNSLHDSRASHGRVDIFKALALGATAVGAGRPYTFGLAAFGQAGVKTALDILDSELRMVMRQTGTPASRA